MEQKKFDVGIVGTGTSAYYCAHALAKEGKRIAIVDELGYGGTCALRGCQPKKYLVANAEAISGIHHLLGKGITGSSKSDWQALQSLKNEFTDTVSENSEKGFRETGIETFNGMARFVSKDTIRVNDSILKCETIVLATGSKPRNSDISGAEFLQDSEYFLNLPNLPRKIIFIGGGYISFEFAHVAARSGAQVTILHRSEKPLKAFDLDMVKIILQASKEAGIKVITNEPAVEVKKRESSLVVLGGTGNSYEADLVIEASGRIPNLSILEDEAGNIDFSARGIEVNEYLQSISNRQVYAIGDVANTPYQLAPVADREGGVVAHNILHGNTRTVDYSIVPSSVFTIPTLATVGFTEEAALKSSKHFRINKGSTNQWPSSKRIGERHAGFKIIIEENTEKILGAHLVRHNAGEVINVFALAMQFGLTTKDLQSVMWAYPTYTSDLKYMIG